jgi:hypothetical protein
MDQRQVVRLLAVARVAVGAIAFAAPRRAGSIVFGGRSRDGAMAVVVRTFAARDLILGLGTLRALDRDVDPVTWAKASAAADAADAVAALLGLGSLPTPRALAGATSALTASITGFRASTRLA